MSATKSKDHPAPPQFQQPEGCPFTVCSAIAMYQDELERHRRTEASLRDSLLREGELLARKDELLLQKDTLSKEFEHRLLNGLQLISSLLATQSRVATNSEVATQLTIAANRAATVARVHRHLHLDNAKSVKVKRYLKDLCKELANLASTGESQRSIVVEGAELQIPAHVAIPLGFITCELVTNAIKYAKGRIELRLQGNPPALSISDDGPGLPQNFDPIATTGLGMMLVPALVKQISGTLEIDKGGGNRGARFTVTFPVLCVIAPATGYYPSAV